MAQTIHLHGGPWHGQTHALEDGRDHFHVLSPMTPAEIFKKAKDDGSAISRVPKKEGTYSRVGSSQDFEWDGWTSHD